MIFCGSANCRALRHNFCSATEATKATGATMQEGGLVLWRYFFSGLSGLSLLALLNSPLSPSPHKKTATHDGWLFEKSVLWGFMIKSLKNMKEHKDIKEAPTAYAH